MPTTFNWIPLGASKISLDPTEGNTTAENADAFVGQSFGSAGSPLFSKITTVTTIDKGGTLGALDMDNTLSNDLFTTNLGSGTQTYTFDGTAVYNATVTYADGTTGKVTAVIAQDTAGNLYLAPDPAAGMDEAVYEAKPILSLKLDSVSGKDWSGMGSDRFMTGFDDGYVDGTANGDLIDASYVEPIGGGSDRIDNGDAGLAGSSGHDDHVRAGAGNDTIRSGQGNDSVDAGTGNDVLDGGAGADRLSGGDGDDRFVLSGSFGNDTIIGGEAGETTGDTLDASALTANTTITFTANETGTITDGSSTASFSQLEKVVTGSGNNTVNATATTNGVHIDAGAGNDTMMGGSGADTLLGGSGSDVVSGGAGNDSLSGGGGSDRLSGGAGNDTLTGGLGSDVFELDMSGGSDRVTDFDMGLTGKRTFDQLDVSDLLTAEKTPVKTWDVTISDDGKGNALLSFPGGESLVLQGVAPEAVKAPGMLAAMGVPCFASGTRITTPEGQRCVESLKPGDMVTLADGGIAPILWVGARRLEAVELAAHPALRPVLVKSGAHGARRDLILSPQHAVEVTGPTGRALVRAGHLARLGWSARLALGMKAVCYHHLLLPRHALILADGVRVESLFPGRLALSGFAPAARTDLLATLARHTPAAPGQTLVEAYGPRCLPLIGFAAARALKAHLAAPQAALRNHPALQPMSLTL